MNNTKSVAMQELVQSLIEGKTKPENEVIAYFVKQAKDLEQEANAIETEIRRTQDILKALEASRQQVFGAMTKTGQDLVAWLSPAAKAPPTPEPMPATVAEVIPLPKTDLPKTDK